MTTIIVADDRPLNREYLVALLGCSGFRIVEASDGAEALVLARVEEPGLMITDMIMPGMDGRELVTHMKADPKLARIPVIFYSATYLDYDPRTEELGLDDTNFILRPIEPEALVAKIEACLAGVGKATA